MAGWPPLSRPPAKVDTPAISGPIRAPTSHSAGTTCGGTNPPVPFLGPPSTPSPSPDSSRPVGRPTPAAARARVVARQHRAELVSLLTAKQDRATAAEALALLQRLKTYSLPAGRMPAAREIAEGAAEHVWRTAPVGEVEFGFTRTRTRALAFRISRDPTSRTKVSNLSSPKGSSVPSRSCPARTPPRAWPASSCWHWR
jgi:hypothetical protein